MNQKFLLLITGVVLNIFIGSSQERVNLDLSSQPWNITLDRAAVWQNDELYLPPVDIKALPVNTPTGGWQLLEHPDKTGINLPATVEEHLWGWNGQTFGVTGNYTGVSWFETEVDIPAEWKDRRIAMNIGSVRFRAEIFVNHQLAGYDLVNSTPFSIDITPFIEPGKKNVITFRITDPNGNFNWKDSQVYTWGVYRTNPSHGFGGITGKVELEATGKLYVKDVFIKNQPEPHAIEVEVRAVNETGASVTNKELCLEIKEHPNGQTVYRKNVRLESLKEGENLQTYQIKVPNAHLWSVDSPRLYDLKISLNDDAVTERFGFRWFEIKDVKGDRQFFLNGKRIVLRTAISWGFWPYNGITPSDELTKRQITIAKELGLNMLNFHRNIGQTNILDYADELGLLYFEEPGGNQYPIKNFNDNDKQSNFYFAYRNEKLARMVKRDRNHPSLLIWTPTNEEFWPDRVQYPRLMHDLYNLTKMIDPTRPFHGASGGTHIATDIWTVHNYEQDPAKLKEKLYNGGKLMEAPKWEIHLMPMNIGYNGLKYTDQYAFPEYKKDMPYLVDEFGGIKWNPSQQMESAQNTSWGYGEPPRSLEEFYARLEGQVDAVLSLSNDIWGYCYTQLTDVEQEQNGIYYYDRTPKFDMKRIHAIFSKTPDSK